ncbi:hypothetical protein FGG08_000546 [Glutinoglossum americanum]|uniref:Peroxidase n=1 Tax=Glutinoglossum americanum TaxID=1670608 RepID=A0A9P8ID21_9PEZI|nr:hypothetical protein FGG08_000546 [Glutinoglossum americanum]
MAPPSFGQRILIWIFKVVNKIIPWHRLPSLIGVLNLSAYRDELRSENLYDTYPSADFQGTASSAPMDDPRFLTARNSDGKFNSLEQPLMGCTGMRFGRNVPREFTAHPTQEELLTPNPRVVSERLLARQPGGFKPATSLNLLAAAWIQFQVHDWFAHENSTDEKEVVDIPLPEGDSWPQPCMKVPRTQPEIPLDETDKRYPAYKNTNTAWWDGSQIYGSDEGRTKDLRGKSEDGKLILDTSHPDVFLPRDGSGIPKTGFSQNWWLGLEILHTLFALEHNAICTELRAHNPTWTSDKIFDTARLINCALMAKIHTVEWTPGILAHPTLKIAMNANWWGLLGKRLHKLLGRVSKSEGLSGIPGSGAEQFAAPYSLTEEFVSVYRLHPLIPDDIVLFDVTTGEQRAKLSMHDVAFENARKPMDDGLGFKDVIYSFGINHPGAITLRNTPDFLRGLKLPDGQRLDIAAVDILRDRERGVPRYNQFRRLLHLKPVRSFEELTGNDIPLALEISDIYNGDIETVDLLVGMFAEPLPKGFGFSDTAFRVFILMASRRLKSDRFIATDWNEGVYTKEGLEWVEGNGMKDVLGRHFPELRDVIKDVENVFAPWREVGVSGEHVGQQTKA